MFVNFMPCVMACYYNVFFVFSVLVLMRALWDFNLTMILTDGVLVFLGLISGLFPFLEVLWKRALKSEQMVCQSITKLFAACGRLYTEGRNNAFPLSLL